MFGLPPPPQGHLKQIVWHWCVNPKLYVQKLIKILILFKSFALLVESLSFLYKVKLVTDCMRHWEQCLYRVLNTFPYKRKREKKRERNLSSWKNLHAAITRSSPMTFGLKKNAFTFSHKISFVLCLASSWKEKPSLFSGFHFSEE